MRRFRWAWRPRDEDSGHAYSFGVFLLAGCAAPPRAPRPRRRPPPPPESQAGVKALARDALARRDRLMPEPYPCGTGWTETPTGYVVAVSSWAEQAGLRPGDRIVTVGGAQVVRRRGTSSSIPPGSDRGTVRRRCDPAEPAHHGVAALPVSARPLRGRTADTRRGQPRRLGWVPCRRTRGEAPRGVHGVRERHMGAILPQGEESVHDVTRRSGICRALVRGRPTVIAG